MKDVKPPFVSCICITRNRRVFLRRAAEQYNRAARVYAGIGGRSQMCIYDGSDAGWLFPTFPVDDRFGHLYKHDPSSVLKAGDAHNEACEMAQGDLIIQWDDDDWQSPDRIVRQVAALERASFAYSSQFYWYHLERRQACRARSWDEGNGSTGALFAYWKDTWKRTPFAPVDVGEDIGFFGALRTKGEPMHDAKDPGLVVYMRHNRNGSALTNYAWNDQDTERARAIVGGCDGGQRELDFYDGLGEILPVANWNHPNAPGSKMHMLNPLANAWGRHFR